MAIIVSLLALAYQAADPPLYVLGRKRGTNVFRPRSNRHPKDETFPGLLLLRPEGRVFFANAENIGQKIKRLVQETQPKIVALDLSGVFDLEYTALNMLTEGEKRQREQGVTIWLVAMNPRVLRMIRKSRLGEVLGRDALHFTLESAIEKYLCIAADARRLAS